MINIELKEVHVGQAIKKRIEELNMTKTEFGRLIGVPQQHINRILERETMETMRLVKVCKALDFNFFALFCQFTPNVNAYLAAVALGDGDAQNTVGDASLLSQIDVYKEKIIGMELFQESLKAQIAQLQSQLRDKDEIINLVKTSK